jgi:hypothetical protein
MRNLALPFNKPETGMTSMEGSTTCCFGPQLQNRKVRRCLSLEIRLAASPMYVHAGTLPPSWVNMSDLATLDLSFNRLTGGPPLHFMCLRRFCNLPAYYIFHTAASFHMCRVPCCCAKTKMPNRGIELPTLLANGVEAADLQSYLWL